MAAYKVPDFAGIPYAAVLHPAHGYVVCMGLDINMNVGATCCPGSRDSCTAEHCNILLSYVMIVWFQLTFLRLKSLGLIFSNFSPL